MLIRVSPAVAVNHNKNGAVPGCKANPYSAIIINGGSVYVSFASTIQDKYKDPPH